MTNSEQCTSSQEQVEESLQTSSLDTGQLPLLSGMNTVAKCSEKELKMDGSRECMCMKEMSNCLIHPSGREEWIASVQDSLAKILAIQALRQVLAKIRAQDYTGRHCALPMWYDLPTSSWKMSQASFLEEMESGSEQSLQTLPREGMMLSGNVYQLPKLVVDMSAIDGGCLRGVPTPTAQDNNQVRGVGAAAHHPNRGTTLGGWARMLPTPVAHEVRLGYQRRHAGAKGTQESLTTVIVNMEGGREKAIGQLNPFWVAWFMGWPIGHICSKLWGTDKSLSKLQQHSQSSGK